MSRELWKWVEWFESLGLVGEPKDIAGRLILMYKLEQVGFISGRKYEDIIKGILAVKEVIK